MVFQSIRIMPRSAKEIWKKIKFPGGYKTDKNYQVSNYGRVRLLLNGAVQMRRMIHYDGQIRYRFSMPASLNGGERKMIYVKAPMLVAKNFCKDYFEGCYVQHKDFNRLNNYYTNILCLGLHEARSHAAKGRYKRTQEFLVEPPEEKIIKETHRITIDDDFFKPIPGFANYEISRSGVIKRRKPPLIGRVMKARVHPDGFYFLDLRDDDNKRKTVYVHKAVAQVWNINLRPTEQNIVVHLDGDTLNNHSDNLEWMTPSAAMKLQFKHKKRDNRKSWKTRKKLYGNGFKNKKPAGYETVNK
nr:NUMOD4 domain-containing protein [Fulvivirga aurantia]